MKLLLMLVSLAFSQNQPWWEQYRVRKPDVKMFEYLQSLAFNGEFRLRHDVVGRKGGAASAQNGRSRNRLRLRLGVKAELPWDITAVARLASGPQEQGSANQTFDNLSSQKPLWIDHAYARWAPELSAEGDRSFWVQGGRMGNPLWRLKTSEVIFDDDMAPEGFAQGAEWLLPMGVSLFANAMQAVADEDSNTARNQWYFSQQAGFEAPLPLETRLKVAAAWHAWTDTQRNTFGQVIALDGNRRLANGTLANRFRIAELSAEYSVWAGRMPVRLQTTLARNVAAIDLTGTAACPAANTCPKANDAYYAALILGRARVPGSWELGLLRKYAQTDAVVSDVSDSNLGDGGTNQEGYTAYLTYVPAPWMQVRARYHDVDTIDTQFNPGDKAVRRLQLDWLVTF